MQTLLKTKNCGGVETLAENNEVCIKVIIYKENISFAFKQG